jgi:hypothetical protein
VRKKKKRTKKNRVVPQKKRKPIMKDRVDSFLAQRRRPMKYYVQAMERGVLHVDAINSHGNTFGIVFIFDTLYFEDKYWLRYWALKPSVQKFWKLLTSFCDSRRREAHRLRALSRAVLIPALWKDLYFIYNLASAKDLYWLRQEVEQRVSASLRFEWIAAAV